MRPTKCRSYCRAVHIKPRARIPAIHRHRATSRSSAQLDATKFDIDIPLSQIAAAVGSKEFVVTTPQWMKLRTPSRDTVLFPAVSYPSYAMGATLSGCRPVAVPMTASGGIDISKISADDAKRALMIWMNSPSNPTGALDDMEAVVNWGRANNVPVFSDECYVEFTWQGKPTTALQYGTEGVIALHSLSKRSNLAGLRVAFYAGDADIVHYLKEVRKHAGLMVPGPAQAAGVVALNDVEGVKVQAQVYRRRLERTATGAKQVVGQNYRVARWRFLLVVRRNRWLGVCRALGNGRRRTRQPRRFLRCWRLKQCSCCGGATR
jgi:aspartate/methionine/tyrosine aminotransferase